MCWYLNETNTDEITIAEVNAGDIITFRNAPEHGTKIHSVSKIHPRSNRREMRYSGGRWNAPATDKVLRLRSNPDGTVMCATNR